MSSPCTIPTSFPHGDLKKHFDIFLVTTPAFLILFSISRCHELAACYVQYRRRLNLPQRFVRVSISKKSGSSTNVFGKEFSKKYARLTYNVVLAFSSRRRMTEYTFHQIQSRSPSVIFTVRSVHPFVLLWNQSNPEFWFLLYSFVRDNPFGFDHFASICSFQSTTSRSFITSMNFCSSALA